ncbi:MAG: TolC family protein [Motiliproteus sp.]|nr:TolC family protein [Motiliproteus sp.]MCW9054161.1 TolC family protein [Motiliproteus sp.]
MIKLKTIVISCSACLFLSGGIAQAKVAEMTTEGWASKLQQQLQQHPRWKSMTLQSHAGEQDLAASEQPLYNPELELSFEDNAEDVYGLAVNQQIDWHGKKDNRRKVARTDQQIIHFERSIEINEMISSALNSMLELQFANNQLQQAELRLQLTSRLIDAVKKRVKAGDLNTVDLQLAQLSLADAVLAKNEAEKRRQEAEADKNSLIGETLIPVPKRLLSARDSSTPNFEQLGKKLPEFQIAHLKAIRNRLLAKQARLAAKPEPSVGLGIGKDGDENTLTLSLSIPFNIRNNFNAEIRAADTRSLIAEQKKQDVFIRISNKLKSTWGTMQRTNELIKQWPQIDSPNNQTLNQQLEKQWQLGDLNTSSYLQNMQQQNDALAAKIALKAQANRSFIEWLRASNQLETWLQSQAK